MQYCDYRVFGTTSTTALQIAVSGLTYTAPITLAQYTASFYASITIVTGTALGSTAIASDGETSVGAYVSTPIFSAISLTTTLTRFNGSGTFSGLSTNAIVYLNVALTSGAALDVTFRLAGCQLELGASATTFQNTPSTLWIPPPIQTWDH
jgi:hypothetical protein